MKQFKRNKMALMIAALVAASVGMQALADDGAETETVDTDVVETESTMGVGEQNISDALSQAMVDASVDSEAGEIDFDTASADILEMRESGMGWGEIANELGFRLGDVVSDFHQADQAKVNRLAREGRASDRSERVERGVRPERSERAERAERPERVERVARPERPEKPERPGRG